MEQRMSVWIGFHSFVKGFVDKRVIIALTEYIGHDTPVAKVKNGAQIEFMYRNPLVPFELRHIGQPFFIGLVRVKLAVQKILRNVLWVLGTPGATLISVLDGGFDIRILEKLREMGFDGGYSIVKAYVSSPTPKNHKISSAFSYNFKSALTIERA